MRAALHAILIALLLALLAKWLFGDYGLLAQRRVAEQLAREERAVQSIQARNRRLAAQVEDLKQGMASVEQLARERLGMVREGETFIRIYEDPPSKSADGRAGEAPPAAPGSAAGTVKR